MKLNFVNKGGINEKPLSPRPELPKGSNPQNENLDLIDITNQLSKSMKTTEMVDLMDTLIKITNNLDLLLLNTAIEAARTGKSGIDIEEAANNLREATNKFNFAANEFRKFYMKKPRIKRFLNKKLTSDSI